MSIIAWALEFLDRMEVRDSQLAASWKFCLTKKGKPVVFGHMREKVAVLFQDHCQDLFTFDPKRKHMIPRKERSARELEQTFKTALDRLFEADKARWGNRRPKHDADNLSPVLGASIPFSMPSDLVSLLGIVTSGAHLNVFHGKGSGMKIWLMRRGPSMSSYPNVYDQLVAGGTEPTKDADGGATIRREASEEIENWEAKFPRWRETMTTPASTLQYHFVNPSKVHPLPKPHMRGMYEPGIRYVFDYEVSDPQEDFWAAESRMTVAGPFSVSEVEAFLKGNQFKPNCALVMVDFLMRKGAISPGIQGYEDLKNRLARKLPFDTTYHSL
ncbi:hypothetical protein ACRALDRAFT_1060100 [Sodiomyces alcalophilus JCM 7366]|uniref:uncharacterized protein n=1 Tax=Sodiomyces alcalophilus JCM 7366 TaxID=591952 RepID=UPI0039B5743A